MPETHPRPDPSALTSAKTLTAWWFTQATVKVVARTEARVNA
jgi:hypothetical protein